MRKINKIILHCSDSDDPSFEDWKIIDDWHKRRGFKKIGYHFCIKKNGDIQLGRELPEVGAHCENENYDSIGVCIFGKKYFSKIQLISASKLIRSLLETFNLTSDHCFGHYEFNHNKTCPNLDMIEFRRCLYSRQEMESQVKIVDEDS